MLTNCSEEKTEFSLTGQSIRCAVKHTQGGGAFSKSECDHFSISAIFLTHSHSISACAANHKNMTEVVEQRAWKASPDQKEEIGGSGVQEQWFCGRKERRTPSEG